MAGGAARNTAAAGTPGPREDGLDDELWRSASHLIRNRRSNLRIDPDRPVPGQVIDRLIELACWAPNHKHTHPWRFAVVTGAGRERLGEAAAEGFARLGVAESSVLEKTRRKYLRAPVILVVGSAAHEVPYLHTENRDAVAAGVQNLLLGATALGLASYWSSGVAAEAAAVKALAGLRPDDEIVALVYLGWPLAEAPPAARPAPVVTVVDQ